MLGSCILLIVPWQIAMKVGPNWETVTRIPAWGKFVRQEPGNPVLDGLYWNPPGPAFQWKHPRPPKPDRLHIYEAHSTVYRYLPTRAQRSNNV